MDSSVDNGRIAVLDQPRLFRRIVPNSPVVYYFMDPVERSIILTVLIPLFNEERRLPTTIAKFVAFVENFSDDEGRRAELLLVDDGSDDGTYALIQRYQREYAHLPIQSVTTRHLGKGGAIRYGMSLARGQQVLMCDCDLSTSLEEYARFAELLRDYDIVIGSRKISGARVEKPQGILKRMLGMVAQYLIRIVVPLDYDDISCGFKLFGPVAKRLFAHSIFNNAGQDMEILFLARIAELRVIETGVVWINNNDSRFGPMSYVTALCELIKLRCRIWNKSYDVAAIRNIRETK